MTDEFPTRAQMDAVARLARGTVDVHLMPDAQSRTIEVRYGIERTVIGVDGQAAQPAPPPYVMVRVPRDLAEAILGPQVYAADAAETLERVGPSSVPYAMHATVAALLAAIRDEFNVPEPVTA